MKYPTVDALLDNKTEVIKDTLRPNVQIDDKLWYDFTYALDYVNMNRPTRLHASAILEGYLNDFIENIKFRMSKEEGTVNGFMMYMSDRRLDRETSDKKKRVNSANLLKEKVRDAETDTLDYSGKKPRYK